MLNTRERPGVVCICGSTRFRRAIAEANRDLTLAGKIVLAPGVFAHDGDTITDDQKAGLDRLHLAKIDLSDALFVVNPGGYIGESTRREIAYAREHGKPVTFLIPECHSFGRDDDGNWEIAADPDCPHDDNMIITEAETTEPLTGWSDDPEDCRACLASNDACPYHLGRRRGEELGLAEGMHLGWKACERSAQPVK